MIGSSLDLLCWYVYIVAAELFYFFPSLLGAHLRNPLLEGEFGLVFSVCNEDKGAVPLT